MKIRFEETKNLKEKPAVEGLGFGKYYTDYMFMLDWYSDKGFDDPRIIPYAPIPFDPACLVLHYAQETFEGMKAYRGADGKIRLFRPYENIRRMNNSCERLCIPNIPEDLFIEALKTLVILIAPFAPHMTEELWHNLGKEESIHRQSWPVYQEEYTVEDKVTVVIQINGKVRGKIEAAADLAKDKLESLALAEEKIAAAVAGKNVVKVIVVPNKLVNIVVQ